jgi:hypothetical protein
VLSRRVLSEVKQTTRGRIGHGLISVRLRPGVITCGLYKAIEEREANADWLLLQTTWASAC